MSAKRLSVVIPTYNRRERLARVVGALERQRANPEDFEVVVVDDGSTDGTSEWLPAQRTGYALRWLRLANGGPARARNAGVEAAVGETILFLDDDVEPTESLIAEHLQSHDREQDVVVIGPLASLPHYGQPWVAWEQAKVERQYEAMVRGEWQPTYRQFWTGNASLAKRHLTAVGGFNAEFLRAEDVELGIRLMHHGLGFRFNPVARGIHHAERSLASWEKMHSSYGRLEIEIFNRLGDAELERTLLNNWENIHPAIRRVVESCIDRPMRHSAVRTVLHGHLRLAERVPFSMAAEKACSLLANLLYWQASSAALGAERMAKVFERARLRATDPGR